MAAVIAREPLESAARLQALKYQLLSEGVDEPHFHASEDRQAVRDRVFASIGDLPGASAHVLWVDKHRAAPALQNAVAMYSLFGKAIATYLLMSLPNERDDQIVLIFDKALTNRQEASFLAAVKPALNKLGRPYRIYFQSVNFDFNGQVADYLAWAQYVKLERDEGRPLASIGRFPYSQFDLFRNGHTIYY